MSAISNGDTIRLRFDWEPIVVLGLGVLGFVAWVVAAGPDIHWDFLHYHLYAGLNADGGRLHKDFEPTDGMSNFVPYGHWPIAIMIVAKWPAMVVGAVMAAMHSLAVVATWFLARQLFPGHTVKSFVLRLVSTILGVACPLVLMEVGTSFIDITSAIPTVLGVAFLLKATSSAKCCKRTLFVAGLCFGVGTTLKLSAAPYALAAVLALGVMALRPGGQGWTSLMVLAAGESAGFAATYGFWGYQLWREFGNPFYPYFESFFVQAPGEAAAASPSIVTPATFDWLWAFRANLHQRFLPHGFWDWILRPIYMLDPVPNVYVEVSAPDARFLLLFCLIPFAAWRLYRRTEPAGLSMLLVFFLIGWILWMAISGNGRYLMPLALVAGPLVVSCAAVVWPRFNVLGVSVLILFAALQTAGLWFGATYRWTSAGWQKYWFSASLPHEVTDSPVTFVSMDTQSVSWLSAFMHSDSRLVKAPAAEAGLRAKQAERILKEPRPIFAVFKFSAVDVDSGQPFPRTPENMKPAAIAHNLNVDFQSCLTGTLDTTFPARFMVTEGSHTIERRLVHGFFFCPADYKAKRELGSQAAMDPRLEFAFERIEESCPTVFYPKGQPTHCESSMCLRKYYATDRSVVIASDGVIRHMYYRAAESPVIATLNQLTSGQGSINCHAGLGRYVPGSPGASLFSKEPDAKR